jgi:hypothetical protein
MSGAVLRGVVDANIEAGSEPVVDLDQSWGEEGAVAAT